ncbi:hypothetical protein C8J56DRAFT_890753 [Mycena floridula]|nr:hypothetical protein C8J56DRAFT_890753 [Mycena floridula]
MASSRRATPESIDLTQYWFRSSSPVQSSPSQDSKTAGPWDNPRIFYMHLYETWINRAHEVNKDVLPRFDAEAYKFNGTEFTAFPDSFENEAEEIKILRKRLVEMEDQDDFLKLVGHQPWACKVAELESIISLLEAKLRSEKEGRKADLEKLKRTREKYRELRKELIDMKSENLDKRVSAEFNTWIYASKMFIAQLVAGNSDYDSATSDEEATEEAMNMIFLGHSRDPKRQQHLDGHDGCADCVARGEELNEVKREVNQLRRDLRVKDAQLERQDIQIHHLKMARDQLYPTRVKLNQALNLIYRLWNRERRFQRTMWMDFRDFQLRARSLWEERLVERQEEVIPEPYNFAEEGPEGSDVYNI